jgi:hypothetical protein
VATTLIEANDKRMGMQVVAELMRRHGTVYEVDAKSALRLTDCVYAVVNGEDVLQLGKGSGARAAKTMRGSIAAKHNKAFVCSMYEAITGLPNRYIAVECPSRSHAEAAERELHSALGISTNQDAAVVLRGHSRRWTMRALHCHVVERVLSSAVFAALTEREQRLAHQLFDLICFGTTRVLRSSKTISSTQGDNLEGNILVAVRRQHLIPIFLKLSNNYFRYGLHLPNQDFMDALMGMPFGYFRQHSDFEISGRSGLARVDAPGAQPILIGLGLVPL